MAWDSSRPVSWRRLAREWLIYVAIMSAILLAFFRDRPLIGIFTGLLVSLPLYLAFGFVLAKFGYQRTTLKKLRTGAPVGDDETEEERSVPRPRPAPTKRTGGGSKRRR